MGFKSFQLHADIIKAIDEQGFTTPTPVQKGAIGPILQNKDVLALAQTGTGKTAAFALPILHRHIGGSNKKVRTLVVAPTRELAEQIAGEFRKLGKHTSTKVLAVYGGVSKKRQLDVLKKGVEVLVACPGRLLDVANECRLDFSHLETLVLDEADMMLDMGFMPDIRRLLKLLPEKKQTLLFSATMPAEISKFARQIMSNPHKIQVDFEKPVDTVRHALYPVEPHLKGKLLIALFKQEYMETALVFTRTKRRAQRVGRQLEKAGYKAASLHGDMSQSQRKRSLDGFRNGSYQVLVATDIAARGIDISDITHVINFDIPDTVEAYVHRIGRTGRAAKSGDAYTLVSKCDRDMVMSIEMKMNQELLCEKIEGFDYNEKPSVDYEANAGRGGNRGGRSSGGRGAGNGRGSFGKKKPSGGGGSSRSGGYQGRGKPKSGGNSGGNSRGRSKPSGGASRAAKSE